MQRIITAICLLLCFFSQLNAQKSGYRWVFGANVGLDFNVTPTAEFPAGGYAREGTSSIARANNGEFLFSTDGLQVINRTGSYTPNTQNPLLGGDQSSTQSALIVPFPNDTNKFYIFTTPSIENIKDGTNTYLRYSIFDLTLDGGLGDVSIWNVPLMNVSTEKICAVGNCDGSIYWVLAHMQNSDKFYAYKITSTGIAAPVITAVGTPHIEQGTPLTEITAANIGYMKFNATGTKVGLCIYNPVNKIELLDFNFSTGILSNPITDTFIVNKTIDVANSHGVYGCSFSPDGSKFYVSLFKSGVNTSVLNLVNSIYQYDLSNYNAGAIIASKTIVASYTPQSIDDGFGALQNGPDGKMYIPIGRTGDIYLINTPNAKGLACAYSYSGITFAASTTGCLSGLPNIVESFLTIQNGAIILPSSATICPNDTFTYSTSNTTTFTVTPNSNYLVNASGTSIKFYPSASTTYTVSSASSCGALNTNIIAINVGAQPIASFNVNPQNEIAVGNIVTLTNTSSNALNINWFVNANTIGSNQVQQYSPSAAGDYCALLIATSSAGCIDSAEYCFKAVANTPIAVETVINFENAFTPNGDNLNETFAPWKNQRAFDNSSVQMQVYNRYGQCVYNITERNSNGWDGTFKGVDCEIGAYYFILKGIGPTDNVLSFKGDVTLMR
jgi:gliding motility-associated-like protein